MWYWYTCVYMCIGSWIHNTYCMICKKYVSIKLKKGHEDKKVTGHDDRWHQNLTGRPPFLAGHWPMTGRYFEPCDVGPEKKVSCFWESFWESFANKVDMIFMNQSDDGMFFYCWTLNIYCILEQIEIDLKTVLLHSLIYFQQTTRDFSFALTQLMCEIASELILLQLNYFEPRKTSTLLSLISAGINFRGFAGFFRENFRGN